MSIEKALVSMLTSDADVNSKVGSRIFPIFVPAGQTLPALTYQEISSPRDSTMDGASGLVFGRYQINCWTKNYRAARELADLVEDALAPKNDDYPKTVEGMYIKAIKLLNGNDVPSIHSDNEELSGLGKMLDFSVDYRK